MLDRLQRPIRRLLRVPEEPDPPLGEAGSVRVFRAAPGFLRYRLAKWGLSQSSAVVGLVLSLVLLANLPELLPDALPEGLQPFLDWTNWIWVAEGLAIAAFLLQLPFSFLLLLIDYRYRWYVTTDRSLRIREGIWNVQERTMSFSNIQNLSIRQGPIQRLFGISDLQVQTAGGGGTEGEAGSESLQDHLHVGYFRGVDNASEIRDAILAHLQRLREAGLGDPDEVLDRPVADWLLAAAREVLEETRALAARLPELLRVARRSG